MKIIQCPLCEIPMRVLEATFPTYEHPIHLSFSKDSKIFITKEKSLIKMICEKCEGIFEFKREEKDIFIDYSDADTQSMKNRFGPDYIAIIEKDEIHFRKKYL